MRAWKERRHPVRGECPWRKLKAAIKRKYHVEEQKMFLVHQFLHWRFFQVEAKKGNALGEKRISVKDSILRQCCDNKYKSGGGSSLAAYQTHHCRERDETRVGERQSLSGFAERHALRCDTTQTESIYSHRRRPTATRKNKHRWRQHIMTSLRL